MKNVTKSLFVGILLLLLLTFISGCIQKQPTSPVLTSLPSTVSGFVTPPGMNILVRLVQDDSIIAETLADSKTGIFEFSNVADGKYGLMVLHGEMISVYGVNFNSENWHSIDIDVVNVTGQKGAVTEINLNTIHGSFKADAISVKFNSSVSQEEKMRIIESCNCDIIRESLYNRYRLGIPQNQNVLQIAKDLRANPYIISADPLFPMGVAG